MFDLTGKTATKTFVSLPYLPTKYRVALFCNLQQEILVSLYDDHRRLVGYEDGPAAMYGYYAHHVRRCQSRLLRSLLDLCVQVFVFS